MNTKQEYKNYITDLLATWMKRGVYPTEVVVSTAALTAMATSWVGLRDDLKREWPEVGFTFRDISRHEMVSVGSGTRAGLILANNGVFTTLQAVELF